MANDSLFPEEGKRPAKDTSSDSGLGNLPPLSDFDSQTGLSPSDSGALPPLGNFDKRSGPGGLPAISDIDIETPNPTGGNIHATPPSFGSSGFGDTFSSGSGIETPSNPSGGGLSTPGRGGSGFQDLAADSDFSPETPEIGPGPESNVDTPMFDSAFGGGSGGFGAAVSTPMATQAMETPMFGGSAAPPAGGGGAFGKDTFGGFDFNAGTPAPDFSPDTDLRQMQPPTTGADGGKKGKVKAPKGGGGGGAGVGILAGIGIAALIVGILAGPYVSSFLPFLPNPNKAALDAAQTQYKDIKAKYDKLVATADPNDTTKVKMTPEEREKLEADIVAKRGELKEATTQLETANNELNGAKASLDQVNKDLQEKNAQYVTAQEQLEEISNQTAIVQARQSGLVAEVERLTGQVGQLEDANARSIASKASLETAVDRLIVQVKEGIPLTPEKYAYAERLASVNALRDKLTDSKWVTPELQQEYTDLYLKELQIAQAQEYFFAKLTVTDSLGVKTQKWAECLMQGNWSVEYRTLDGKNIGSFENIGTTTTPVWGYRENFPEDVRKAIENKIVANRVPGWEEKVTVLAQKQLAMDNQSGFQKAYGSL